MPGVDSAVPRELVFDALPAGAYGVVATVLSADGSEQRATTCFIVRGSASPETVEPVMSESGLLDASNTLAACR
jgi:hypothetical protein